ncbi:hypothetical protein, partial [Escherichia coli]|uniref:hypothetical protein n=1 Tax=Escherichia coli TaxID=562 RepID=UPI0024E0B10D
EQLNEIPHVVLTGGGVVWGERKIRNWGFRISEKEVNRKQTAKHTNYKNVCFAVFKDTQNQDRV